MQTISDRYYELTQKKYVYNITPIANIPSILLHGVMCFDRMKSFEHESVALNEVQERRDKVLLPNGKRLHSYANLYFSYRNPMMYRRKDQAETLCILAIDAAVMNLEGCILTDRNAAASIVRYYHPADGLNELDFSKIHAKYWTDTDIYRERDKKAIKCAEILIPNSVPPEYIKSACVVNQTAKEKLQANGFINEIVIYPNSFFR